MDRFLTPNDKYCDTLTFENRVVLVVSAGNGGITCKENQFYPVASPARAYNVIAVGAFDDKDTSGWSDDCMASLSSWCNPVSTNKDREKPEIVAPGASIKSTLIATPWVGCGSEVLCTASWCACRLNFLRCNTNYWGTSFAALAVTGIAALMVQRSRSLSSALEAWPEAIKAILMATAVHNIEGDTRLSGCDGAGGVVADLADDVVRGVNGHWGAKEYFCNSPSPNDLATMNLVTGQRVRAVIVWATNPVSGNYPDQPNADLDLLIVDSAGNNIVAQSVSKDNPYEIVDFTASGSGTYVIRVVKNECDSVHPPEYLAWAWWAEPPQ